MKIAHRLTEDTTHEDRMRVVMERPPTRCPAGRQAPARSACVGNKRSVVGTRHSHTHAHSLGTAAPHTAHRKRAHRPDSEP